MAQGKLKVKSKLPASVKTKKVAKNTAITKRANRPVAPKGKKNLEAHKLKKNLLKTINESMVKELRSKALGGKEPLASGKKASTSGTSKKK